MSQLVAAEQPLNLQYWTGRDIIDHLDDVLSVYATAMGYDRRLIELRRGHVVAHTRRNEFRAVATMAGENLVGFGYGYRSRPGQWWHDQVRPALDLESYATWLSDCFELAELHVIPDMQGQGLGINQLRALVAEVACRTIALSTPETSAAGTTAAGNRAWRLYRRLGFVDLARNHHFAGDDRPFAILGRPLPLT